ncbi:MAG: NYN domain-containing protein [Zoogloea sp.]|uniref:NYN domain-containing protein n=1 Tax=Zoogloea sp. TaxID=49181 RepID=UPI002623592B|nr:NYN domain-containing protein [Zoogloea sp.]MDD2991506.1 NYN domain-containing protein [Zoogloea sp.]
MKHELQSLAVLIDADNVRLDTLTPILDAIARLGRVTVRRIYGDFTTPHLAGWRLKLSEHAIHPIQQYRNTTGKNASDSALIIDAMDLLHSRRFDGFCLVSSDSDFTRLATRIREDGLMVFGFGEKQTPKAFVNACDRFNHVEELTTSPLEVIATRGVPAETPPAAVAPAAPVAPAPPPSAPKPPTPAKPTPTAHRPLPQASAALRDAYRGMEAENGWVMVVKLFSKIRSSQPEFKPPLFGCSSDLDLIEKTKAFDLENRPHKKGHTYFCRAKDFVVPKAVPKATKVTKAVAQPQTKAGLDSAITQALLQAVKLATTENGWAPIAAIGMQFKAMGKSIKGSGHSTLTNALKATGKVEMRGSGMGAWCRGKG